MSAARICPTCGSTIPAQAADGLCFKCLSRLGFLAEPSAPVTAGLLRMGDYVLLAEIARGGMGVVYRARQSSLNRMVALKVLLHGPFASPDFVRRFRHEAQVVAALRHPNIVTIYEIGECHGNHFLSLELVEGRNFAELVRERSLPARTAAGYLQTIAEAVGYAHECGVLHRDLKPSNILLDAFDQPRVTDFGLAKLVNSDAHLTLTGEMLGSPNYMPPEQAAGSVSAASPAADVYSLGAILYELLTGRPPFQGETLQAVLAHVHYLEPVAPRRLNPGVPVDLQTICLKCLQKEPARRYASAQALAADLGRFLDCKPIHARSVSLWEQAWLGCRRRPLLATLTAGLLAAVTLGVTGIIWQWRQAVSHAQGELIQRQLAEQHAAKTRLNLYAADMAVASQALQNGDLARARHTLETWRPLPGESDLRGFEWRYLWHRCRGEQLATLAGHSQNVTCSAFSPDGILLATGGLDGTVRIWNASRHGTITTLKVTSNQVWSVAFTPDGQWLATGSTEEVALWDVTSWSRHTNYPGEQVVLSKSGTLLATAESNPFYWELAGPVTLWNWRTGALLRRLEQPGRAPALSADGRLLAMSGTNSNITVWDTTTGKLLGELPMNHPVWSLNFSPDGQTLLVAGWSRKVLVWKWAGPSPPPSLSGHQLNVWSAVFSDDGATIATTGSDRMVRLWDAATFEPKSILRGHQGEIWSAAFSPDGQILATTGTDYNVLLWPTAAVNPLNELPHDADFTPTFSPDGRWLVTVATDAQKRLVCRLWNADDHTLVATNLAVGAYVFGFSRDGTCVTVFDALHSQLQFWLPNGSEPQKRVTLAGLPPPAPQFALLRMSPAQDLIFAIDETGLIQIWNPETGQLLHTLSGPVPPIRNATMSPLGRQIAVRVEREKVARLYDCATGVERQLAGHDDFVSGLAFSPDGATLATGSMDGSIRLWNTTNGQTMATLPGHMGETTDVAFSLDGRTLASVGKTESLKLWHLPTLREVVVEDEPHAGIWLRFSPDGRQLAVETDSNKIRLLSARSE